MRKRSAVKPDQVPGYHPKAVATLIQAMDLARRDRVDPWEYAVELPELLDSGLTRAELRSMIHNGYVLHRPARPSNKRITASSLKHVVFVKSSRFVLSAKGVRVLQPARVPADDQRPQWNGELRCLSFRGVTVKEFHQPAINQTCILTAFQEDGWPRRIDDPLPQDGTDSAARLQETIKALNRHQQCCLLHFRGDGSGEAVIWEPRSTRR